MARKDNYEAGFAALAGGDESNINNEEVLSSTQPDNDDLINELLVKKKKVKFDDIHTRKTFSIDNELYKRLMSHFNGKEQGYQTKFIKVAITKLLDELEQ